MVKMLKKVAKFLPLKCKIRRGIFKTEFWLHLFIGFPYSSTVELLDEASFSFLYQALDEIGFNYSGQISEEFARTYCAVGAFSILIENTQSNGLVLLKKVLDCMLVI